MTLRDTVTGRSDPMHCGACWKFRPLYRFRDADGIFVFEGCGYKGSCDECRAWRGE